MFKTSTTNLVHFTLSQQEFNYVVSCIDFYRPMAKLPEALDRVKDKMLKKSLLDKPHNEMKCALNNNDFYILFSVIVANGLLDTLRTPVDYYNLCLKDPDIKPWITRAKK